VIEVFRELLPVKVGELQPGELDPDEASLLRQTIPSLVGQCGQLMVEINREAPLLARGARFRDLRDAVRQLAGAALSLNMGPQAYLCEALNGLLYEAAERPGQLSVSGLRTITQSVDFLSEAFDGRRKFELSGYPVFDILTVDDDSISRCGIQLALGKIKQRAMECSKAEEAVKLCEERSFDLVFLDVEMPGLNGYDVCSRIRRSGPNRAVPIIFVTRHTDLQNRAQATMSGATDFIGKPFNFMELAVKALLHLLRRKLV
jgi:CheY-like chemotaxis protein